MKPMRPATATLAGAGIAVVVVLLLVGFRGGIRWFDLVGAAAAFHGFRWTFINGGISPGYSDPAIEQNRARRAEKRRARRERKPRPPA